MGKHTQITLTEEQRTELERLLRTGTRAARTNIRARILLLSDRSQGQQRTDQTVADAVLCCKSTVVNVRRRFLHGGLQAALEDKGWPGATPKVTGDIEAKLVLLVCSEPPEGAARWTLRLLAERMVELEYIDTFDVKSCVDRVSQNINAKVPAQKQSKGNTRDFGDDPRTQTADRVSQGVFYGTSPLLQNIKSAPIRFS